MREGRAHHPLRHAHPPAGAVRDGLEATIGTLPAHLRGSRCWDQGSEMSTHKSFTTATERPVNLEQVAQELSGRPRKTLGWDNPAERFRDLLVSIQLARWRNV